MKDKLIRFMMGRNGMDSLNRFLLWTAAIILLLSNFIPGEAVRTALFYLGVLGFGFVYWRALSRNMGKRSAENSRFLQWKYRRITQINNVKTRAQQRKQFKFFKCATCGVTLRVPRNKGKILVTCRQCWRKFEAKS